MIFVGVFCVCVWCACVEGLAAAAVISSAAGPRAGCALAAATHINTTTHLVAVVEDRDVVALGEQRLGEVQADEGVAAALGVDNQAAVGAHDDRRAARGRGDAHGRAEGAAAEGRALELLLRHLSYVCNCLALRELRAC